MLRPTTLGRTMVLLWLTAALVNAQSRPPANQSVAAVRQNVEALLRKADEARQARRTRDVGRFARDAAQQAARLEAGDALRLKSFNYLAELEANAGRPEKALELLEAVDLATRQTTAQNADHRFKALVAIAYLHLSKDVAQGTDPARWRDHRKGLVALAGLLQHGVHWKTDRPNDLVTARVAVDLWGWRSLAERANQTAAAGSPQKAVQDLTTQLADFEKRLIAAGGQEHWASLGWLWHCELVNRIHLPQTTGLMDRLLLAIQQPNIDIEYRARYWNLRGQWADEQMNYQEAYRCHAKALELQKQVDGWRVAADRVLFEAQTRNNLGLLQLRLGDVDRAGGLFEEAEELYRAAQCYDDPDIVQKWPDALTTQVNLAEARKRGRSAANYQSSLEILQSVLQKVAPSKASASLTGGSLFVLSHNNLGLLHYECGRFSEANKHFQAARLQAVSIFTERSVRVAEIDVNRGWLALANQQVDEAQQLFSRALEVFRNHCGERHPRTAECLAYLARVLARQNLLAEATSKLNEALAARERSLMEVMSSAISERDRQAFIQELRAHHESVAWPGVLDTYLELAPQLQIPAEQQYAHVLAWKGILGRYVPARPTDLEADESVQQLAQRRESVLAEIRTYAPAKAYRFLQEFEHQLETTQSQHLTNLEQQAEQLSRELAAVSKRFRSRWHPKVPTPEEVREALAGHRPQAGAALLLDLMQTQRHQQHIAGEIAGTGHGYTGFIVHPLRGVARVDFPDGGEAGTLVDQIKEFYAAVNDPRNEEWRQPGTRLSTTLRSQLDAHLSGVRRLLVVPDGWFHLLPWSALPGQKDDSLWLQELSIATLPSVDALLRLQSRSSFALAEEALVVGDIEFGPPVSGRVFFSELEATAIEVKTISDALKSWNGIKRVTSLTGSQATEQAINASLMQQRLVHLATHGYFAADEDNRAGFAVYGLAAQLDSALALAGVNSGPPEGQHDQLLTAEEIGRLDLHQTELVVLSACETGKGHFSEGQGLVGLLGAFHQAGAGAVVSSLWKVPDEATQLLMSSFYKRLLSGQSFDPVEAICSVQQEMATGAVTLDGESVDHPFYWAAWSISGVPRRMAAE